MGPSTGHRALIYGMIRGMDIASTTRNEMFDRIHFAVMAIESGARKLHISGQKMHNRLKAQDLIHNRLLARYEDLHTQSLDWVADDTIETLKNWEASA